MQKLFVLILFFVALTLSVHAQTNSPRLIIRGDDMGFSHAGNKDLKK